jgi:HEAT repeat protein
MIGERPSPSGLFFFRASFALALGIASISGCSTYQGFQFRGTTARSFLRTVEESKDPNARYIAYDNLSSPRCYDDEAQKIRAAQVLTAKLREGKEPIATRAVICRTLGMLRRPEAREMILAATNDEDALVRAEACRALGRVGRPEDATILARVMTLDVSAECRVAAIESLGDLKAPDKRIIEHLVEGMEHEEPVIRVASWNALKSTTGKDFGVDVIAWKKYVDTLPNNTPAALAGARPIPAAAAATIPESANRPPPEIP